MHDPDDGNLGCSTDEKSPTWISSDAIDSSAYLRFEVPDVPRWSIGFAYAGPDGWSLTYVHREGPSEMVAQYILVKYEYTNVDDQVNRITRPFAESALRTGRNELSFRVSSDDSFLRLNGETVIEIPASQLLRSRGTTMMCVGFDGEEREPYSIHYSDLRAGFWRDGVSGSLSHSNYDTGSIECSRKFDDPAFLGFAEDAWVVLNFVAPDVESWSIGILYNQRGADRSDMRITWNRPPILSYVEHVNYESGQFDEGGHDRPHQYLSPDLINSGPGQTNRLEFETSAHGSSLIVNGMKVLDVPSSRVKKRVGFIRLCIGLYGYESAPYTMHFSDLWAWPRISDEPD